MQWVRKIVDKLVGKTLVKSGSQLEKEGQEQQGPRRMSQVRLSCDTLSILPSGPTDQGLTATSDVTAGVVFNGQGTQTTNFASSSASIGERSISLESTSSETCLDDTSPLEVSEGDSDGLLLLNSHTIAAAEKLAPEASRELIRSLKRKNEGIKKKRRHRIDQCRELQERREAIRVAMAEERQRRKELITRLKAAGRPRREQRADSAVSDGPSQILYSVDSSHMNEDDEWERSAAEDADEEDNADA